MSAVPSVLLGDLMTVRSGSVDPLKFPEEVFDLYSIPCFDSRLPEIAIGKSIGSTKQVVSTGDVLLSKIVPPIRRACVVGEQRGRRLIASGEWIVFRNERVDPNYLRHVVVGDPFHAQFMQTVSGVGGSLLRARHAQVAKIEVPLPPLAEQRRIAAILEHAETLRVKRCEAIAQLERLGQAIFREMFGDLVALGGATVADFVKGFESGKSLAADDEDDTTSRYRVLKVSAVTSLTYRPSGSKALPPNYVPPPSHFVRPRDLLFSRLIPQT